MSDEARVWDVLRGRAGTVIVGYREPDGVVLQLDDARVELDEAEVRRVVHSLEDLERMRHAQRRLRAAVPAGESMPARLVDVSRRRYEVRCGLCRGFIVGTLADAAGWADSHAADHPGVDFAVALRGVA